MPNLIKGWKANREIIDEHFVSEVRDLVVFRELDKAGQCQATFRVTDEALAMRPVATGPHQISWCANKKCADGAIIQERAEFVELHIVELKSVLDNKAFSKVRMQADGMFANALALARTVGVSDFGIVKCHLTHTECSVDYSQTTNLVLLKVGLGGAKGGDAAAAFDWARQQITLPFGRAAPLNVVPRTAETTAVDFGTI